MRAALVGKFSYRHGRLGSGIFWNTAKHLYDCHFYCKMTHENVVAHSNISCPIWYSMEKLGWAYPPFSADWILARHGSDLLRLENEYDRILIFSNVLTLVKHDISLSNSNKFAILVDEPKPYTSPSNLHKIALKLRISTIISHFPYKGAVLVPVVYVPMLFSYVSPEKRTSYFIEKRCDMSSNIIKFMKAYNLNLKGEMWKGSNTSTYRDFYHLLGKSRWVFALDKKNSSGQIIAESALLGIPSFVYMEKANGQFVFPSFLRLYRHEKRSVLLDQITNVIREFEKNKSAYSDLSLLIRKNAIKRYHEYHVRNGWNFWNL